MASQKKEAKKTDAFIQTTDKVIHFIQEYKITLLLILAVLATFGLGKVGFNTYQISLNTKGETNLFPIKQKVDNKIIEISNNLASSKKDNSNGITKEEKKMFNSELLPLLKEYEEVINENKNVPTTVFHALRVAGMYSSYENYKSAHELLNRINKSFFNKKELSWGLVNLHRGIILMNLNKPLEAITIFDNILSQRQHEHLFSEVLLQKGLAHNQAKNWLQAKATYSRLRDQYPESPSLSQVKAFLRLLTLKEREAE